ncbi:MAG: hypothetical protein IT561_20570 [Alphaproteobacteria bacterium]|nr:hypothetical protein [Alphaproteobacteria bacterium]
MVTYAWTGSAVLDFAADIGVGADAVFDPSADAVEVTDPAIRATQIDAYPAGGALAFVLVRNADGSPIAGGPHPYVFIPDMTLGQVGVGTGNGPLGNFRLAGGGRFVVGDGTTGTEGDDGPNDPSPVFAGATAPVYFLGLGGADTAVGTAWSDRLLGNLGADRLFGGEGRDSIYGGKDDDVVAGGPGNDLVAGDLGNDTIIPGIGLDVALGGPGSDAFLVGRGDGAYYGGADDDVFTTAFPELGLTFDAAGVADNGLTIGVHVELNGDRGADEFDLSGISGDWTVGGGLGNDTLAMFGAVARLFYDGGPGDDSVDAAAPAGEATLAGGDDNDSFHIVDPIFGGLRLRLDLGAGDDDLTLGGSYGQDVDVDAGGGSDRITLDFHGVADNGLSYGVRIEFGAADDGADGYVGGDVATTVRGGLAGADLDLGAGTESIFILRPPGTGDPTRVTFFNPTFDGFRFPAVYTGGMPRHAFEGADGAGAVAADNFVIATAGEWSIGSFDAFLKAGSADTAKPGFYGFFDSSVGHARIFWDANMTSTDGAVPVIDLVDYGSAASLIGVSVGFEF